MPAPLSSSGDLIVDSWVNYRRHAAVYGEFAMWFAILAVARWAIVAATGAYVTDNELRYALNLLLSLPVFFLHAVLGVAIIDAVSRHLSRRDGTVRDSLYAGFHHVIPALFAGFAGVAVLTLGLTLAIGGALTPPVGVLFVLPGIILLFPGAWLSVRWGFATYAVVIDEMPVVASIKASAKVTAHRWWSVFSRILFPWVFFYVATYFVTSLAFLLLGSVLGDPSTFFGQASATQYLPNTHQLIKAVVSETIEGAVVPLFVAAGILLWNDLKRTA